MSSLNNAPSLANWTELATETASDWALSPDDAGAKEACVEYIGRTALVVTGPYTGARYRFLRPGARLTVDARDRQAMLSIPMLRAVSAVA